MTPACRAARVSRAFVLALVVAAPIAGCGSAARVPGGANPAAVAVIRRWADTLRRGDVQAAARLFALPSEFVNGGPGTRALRIRTLQDAVVVNATLPCGAKLISAVQQGRYINALFRLTGRPGLGGTACGGGGVATARTYFLIAHGMIVQWIRAPGQPGDNRRGNTSGSSGRSGSSGSGGSGQSGSGGSSGQSGPGGSGGSSGGSGPVV